MNQSTKISLRCSESYISTGRNNVNAGKRRVPSPKLEYSVKPDAKSATTAIRAYFIKTALFS
jgi:hypothetical protein